MNEYGQKLGISPRQPQTYSKNNSRRLGFKTSYLYSIERLGKIWSLLHTLATEDNLAQEQHPNTLVQQNTHAHGPSRFAPLPNQ